MTSMIAVTSVTLLSALVALTVVLRGTSPEQRVVLLLAIAEVVRAWRSRRLDQSTGHGVTDGIATLVNPADRPQAPLPPAPLDDLVHPHVHLPRSPPVSRPHQRRRKRAR